MSKFPDMTPAQLTALAHRARGAGAATIADYAVILEGAIEALVDAGTDEDAYARAYERARDLVWGWS